MHDDYLGLVSVAYRRRTILKGGLGAMAAVGGIVMSGEGLFRDGSRFAQAALAADAGDVDILNFALGLEHLENELYKQVNAGGKLTGPAADLARAFGGHEQAHVDALITAIRQASGTPVGPGKYNFPSGSLDTQDNTFRLLATVETIGVGAYTGAANKLKDKALLAAAGSIVQVAARHAALSRLLSGDKRPVPAPLSAMFTQDEVNAQVKPLVAS